MTIEIIGWAIIHSIWQCGLLAAAAALAFLMARQSSPNIRYVIGVTFMLLMVVFPVLTASRMRSAGQRAESGDIRQTSKLALPRQADAVEGIAPSPASIEQSESTNATSFGIVGTSRRLVSDRLRNVQSSIAQVMPWVVAAWLLGLLAASLRLVGGLARTRRITRDGTLVARTDILARVEYLKDRLGIVAELRVLESMRSAVPLVVGALRPAIVVPVSLVTSLTPHQLDMLLAHELAHVRRHDFMVNLGQTVVETLLFYHPGVRWLSERIRDERENCCDDAAVTICGGTPAAYSETLLLLEELRSDNYYLAAAASGGSLLRRVRRLLGGQPAHMELGPRWIAGVITISAALLTGRQAMGSAVQASLTPTSFVSAPSSDTVGKERDKPDISRAGPASVLRSPAAGSLAERMRWAGRRGLSGSYWIGYLVAGDETGKARYYSSDMPVRIDGDVTLSGSINFGDGDISSFTFHGVPLPPIGGAHSPWSTAIFVLMSNGPLGGRVERLHVGSYGLPAYFNLRPVVWLDSTTDAESLEFIRSLLSTARSSEIRRDLVGAIGVHRNTQLVVPILIELLRSRSETAGVRVEAAEWLGRKNDPRAIRVLASAVRGDRSTEVRREAIEAFSHMPTPAATDSLISFVSTIANQDQRRTAIEALGHRPERHAMDFLAGVIRGSADSQLRMEAVEALADIPEGRGLNMLLDFARTGPTAEVRREAVESIGGIEPASRALDVLVQVVRNDPDESVRAEAVETIAEVHDPRSVTILRDIANSNPSERVQREAVESLGETVDGAAALPVLRSIAGNHPRLEVRKEALETFAEAARPSEAVSLLRAVMNGDASQEMRVKALELLGDLEDGEGMPVVREVARSHRDPIMRSRAAEILNDR